MSTFAQKPATLDEIKEAIRNKNFASVKICKATWGACMWVYWDGKRMTKLNLSSSEREEIEQLLNTFGLCQAIAISRGEFVAQYGPKPW